MTGIVGYKGTAKVCDLNNSGPRENVVRLNVKVEHAASVAVLKSCHNAVQKKTRLVVARIPPLHGRHVFGKGTQIPIAQLKVLKCQSAAVVLRRLADIRNDVLMACSHQDPHLGITAWALRHGHLRIYAFTHSRHLNK